MSKGGIIGVERKVVTRSHSAPLASQLSATRPPRPEQCPDERAYAPPPRIRPPSTVLDPSATGLP
ncbi:hypothetical protein FRC09_003278 [Ceratobasidium sp. 395]|nr:hypothetical protein FRC09_003278 [Ceratobasidium sp. 395]